jgi:hypothetical protein
MHVTKDQALPLETTAVMGRGLVMELLVPPLDLTAATVVEKMFVGIVTIPMFPQTSAMAFLMVGWVVISTIQLIITIASIVATAKIRLPTSLAM